MTEPVRQNSLKLILSSHSAEIHTAGGIHLLLLSGDFSSLTLISSILGGEN
jgi:hypothetical protein